jgi:hypothetical protein
MLLLLLPACQGAAIRSAHSLPASTAAFSALAAAAAGANCCFCLPQVLLLLLLLWQSPPCLELLHKAAATQQQAQGESVSSGIKLYTSSNGLSFATAAGPVQSAACAHSNSLLLSPCRLCAW